MNLRNCPVCGLAQVSNLPRCLRCDWSLAALSPERPAALLEQQLGIARENWRRRSCDSESIPDLTRDPFETLEEFVQRLVSRPWYLGQGELRKTGYDIETGRFPIELTQVRDWAKTWVGAMHSWRIHLPRDEARALHDEATQWPVYATLSVQDQAPRIEGLLLAGPRGDLPIRHGTVGPDRETAATDRFVGYRNRYLDPGDGTLVDTQTGLQWMRCALGQEWTGQTCAGCAAEYTWDDALAAAETLNRQGGHAGHGDWRVPTIDELKTLVFCSSGRPGFWKTADKPCEGHYASPTVDQLAFPNTPDSWFWSASTNTPYKDHAWTVFFAQGYVDSTHRKLDPHLRLVRGGQSQDLARVAGDQGGQRGGVGAPELGQGSEHVG